MRKIYLYFYLGFFSGMIFLYDRYRVIYCYGLRIKLFFLDWLNVSLDKVKKVEKGIRYIWI